MMYPKYQRVGTHIRLYGDYGLVVMMLFIFIANYTHRIPQYSGIMISAYNIMYIHTFNQNILETTIILEESCSTDALGKIRTSVDADDESINVDKP